MQVYTAGNTRRAVFPTFGDFISEMKRISDNGGGYYSHGGGQWAGADSLSEAVRICENGWNGGRKTVEDVMGRLQTSLKQMARDMVPQMVHDVAGAYPDMGLFMEGEPECMVQFVANDDQTVGQVCRILVDCGASSLYTAEWMQKRAGAVCALVQALTMVGKSVEVWIASAVTIGKKTHDTTVCVHQAGKSLNVDDIAFALGHPAMLRQMIFSVRHDKVMGYDTQDMGRTCGHIAETKQYLSPEVIVERAENEPAGTPDAVKDPEKWVRHQLVKMGLLGE